MNGKYLCIALLLCSQVTIRSSQINSNLELKSMNSDELQENYIAQIKAKKEQIEQNQINEEKRNQAWRQAYRNMLHEEKKKFQAKFPTQWRELEKKDLDYKKLVDIINELESGDFGDGWAYGKEPWRERWECWSSIEYCQRDFHIANRKALVDLKTMAQQKANSQCCCCCPGLLACFGYDYGMQVLSPEEIRPIVDKVQNTLGELILELNKDKK